MISILRSAIPRDWLRPAEALLGLGVVRLRAVAMVLALSVCVVLFEGIGITMLMPILDFVQADADLTQLSDQSRLWRILISVYSFANLPITLITLSATVLFFTILRQLAGYFQLVEGTKLRHDIGRKMSMQLFERILSSRAEYIQHFNTGSFIYLLGTQVQAANALINSFFNLSMLFMTFLVYGIVILWIAPIASLLAFVASIFALASVNHYVRAGGTISRQIVRAGELWSRFLTERYHAWRLVKLSDTLDRESEQARYWTDRIYMLSVQLARATGRIDLVMTPLAVLVILAGLYFAVTFLSISVPLITLFVVVMMRLMPLAKNFARLRQSIAIQTANLERVTRAMQESENAREEDAGWREFTGIKQAITFQNVSFQYAGSAIPALNDCSLTIPAGKMTAITGRSGAGKSTLVDLLPCLLRPTAGTILADDVPIETYTLRSLRRAIAFVPQTPLILDASVLDNVRYLHPAATLEQVRHACQRAYAHEFIEEIAEGYDAMLGENGVRLSGGQRQRLVLARAFLADPSILILDEPTSALDYESERKVQAALDTLTRSGTVTLIVIAHRLSTIRSADHIVVLREGRVIHQGRPTHPESLEDWLTTGAVPQDISGGPAQIAESKVSTY